MRIAAETAKGKLIFMEQNPQHTPIEILRGQVRDYQVDRTGCCECCGFMEPGLVAWRAEDETYVHCEECFHQSRPEIALDTRAVYMPELSMQAFSHYARVLSWLTFAARADMLGGHDFSKGTLPAGFVTGAAWKAPMKWKSLSEGLVDRYAGKAAKADLLRAKRAFDLIDSRLQKTAEDIGSNASSDVWLAVGAEAFRRDYRPMAEGTATQRIRSWGSEGFTFRLLANRK